MFCECGTLIFPPMLASEEVRCRRCDTTIPEIKFEAISIAKTFEKPKEHALIAVRQARINVPCPRCNKPELLCSSAQLRSADEGQTVFYTCEGCGYKETVQS